jgi:hypothetical protein
MSWSLRVLCVLVVVAAPTEYAAACDKCNAVLAQGVFNEYFNTKKEDKLEGVMSWLYFSKSEDVKNIITKDNGTILKTPLFSIGLDDVQNEMTWKKWKEANIRLFQNVVQSHWVEIDLKKVASPAILNAWNECMKACHKLKNGLSLTLEDHGNGTATCYITWIKGPQDNKDPELKDCQVKGGKIILGFDPKKKPPTILPGVNSHIIFVERTPKEGLTVAIQTDIAGGAVANLQAAMLQKIPGESQAAMKEVQGVWYYLHLERCPTSITASYQAETPGILQLSIINHEGRSGFGTYNIESKAIVTKFSDSGSVQRGIFVRDTTTKGDDCINYVGDINAGTIHRLPLNKEK